MSSLAGCYLAMMDEGRLVVAAACEIDTGEVFVLERGREGTWVPTAFVPRSGKRVGDHFGTALAADSDRVVVGASMTMRAAEARTRFTCSREARADRGAAGRSSVSRDFSPAWPVARNCAPTQTLTVLRPSYSYRC